jgi:hypothetical protein
VPVTCRVGTVVGSVVLVLVLAALTGGWVVVVVVPEADGSLGAVLSAATPGNVGTARVDDGVVRVALGEVAAWLLECCGGLTELLDDVVGVADGVIVAGDADANGVPERGAPSPVDVNGVVGPAATADSGKDGGEPDSNGMATRSAAMPKTDAAPTPFCRRLTFI